LNEEENQSQQKIGVEIEVEELLEFTSDDEDAYSQSQNQGTPHRGKEGLSAIGGSTTDLYYLVPLSGNKKKSGDHLKLFSKKMS